MKFSNSFQYLPKLLLKKADGVQQCIVLQVIRFRLINEHKIIQMQEHSETIRHHIWDKLFHIFESHANGQGYLTPKQLEGIIREILGEESEAQINYVVKNLQKIDANNNGRIEFGEFTNYLLKRHCGELALQRLHKSRVIQNELKMHLTHPQFLLLLRTAFSFLGVTIQAGSIDEIFALSDVDHDGTISYSEYFKFIETYICDFQTPLLDTSRARFQRKDSVTTPELSEMLIRFRRMLWGELFRIYVKYDADGNGDMDDQEMTLLLKELLNETTKSELDYVFRNSFRMDLNGDNQFVFEQFAVFFIKHSCQIGLNRYNRARATTGRRDISRGDFGKLFKNSFCFLDSGLIGQKIINRIFGKIDKDRDGMISYKEYLQWTNELLAYRQRDGLPCFLYDHNIEEVIDKSPDKLLHTEQTEEQKTPTFSNQNRSFNVVQTLNTNTKRPPLPPNSRNSILNRSSIVGSPKEDIEGKQRDNHNRYIDSRANNSSEDSKIPKNLIKPYPSSKAYELTITKNMNQSSTYDQQSTPPSNKYTPKTEAQTTFQTTPQTPSSINMFDKLSGSAQQNLNKNELQVHSLKVQQANFNEYDSKFTSNIRGKLNYDEIPLGSVKTDQKRTNTQGQISDLNDFSQKNNFLNQSTHQELKKDEKNSNYVHTDPYQIEMQRKQSKILEYEGKNYRSVDPRYEVKSNQNSNDQEQVGRRVFEQSETRKEQGYQNPERQSRERTNISGQIQSLKGPNFFQHNSYSTVSDTKQQTVAKQDFVGSQNIKGMKGSAIIGGSVNQRGGLNDYPPETNRRIDQGQHFAKSSGIFSRGAEETSFRTPGKMNIFEGIGRTNQTFNISLTKPANTDDQYHHKSSYAERKGSLNIPNFSEDTTKAFDSRRRIINNLQDQNGFDTHRSTFVNNAQPAHSGYSSLRGSSVQQDQAHKNSIGYQIFNPINAQASRDRIHFKIELPSSLTTSHILATKTAIAHPHINPTTNQPFKLFENPRLSPLPITRLNLRHSAASDTASQKSSARSSCSMPRTYSSQNLATRIKKHTLKLLKTYDTNRNGIIEPLAIDNILRGLLKENQYEMRYVKRNYHRYNSQNREHVTYEMFTEFFLGLHCGEMAVQRYHMSGKFTKNGELRMNEKEFIMSFQGSLDYVDFLAPIGELRQLFREIDLDGDGWITYKEYFEFLKHFFSYLPQCTVQALSRNPSLATTPMTSPLHSARSNISDNQDPEDAISSLVLRQTINILNKNCSNSSKQFNNQNVRHVLRETFKALPVEVDHITRSLSKYDSNDDGLLTTEELSNFIMEKYCGDLVLQRLHANQKFVKFEQRVLGMHDFIMLFETAFSYLQSKPRQQQLMNLFKNLDTDYDGYIAYKKYAEFIREHLGTYKHQETQRKRSNTLTPSSSTYLDSNYLRSQESDTNPRSRLPSVTFLNV